jgi:hypothetical protein
LLRTAWALRGTRGLAPRGLFRFTTFEEAQTWLRSEMSQRSALQPSKTSDASVVRSEAGAHGNAVILRRRRTTKDIDLLVDPAPENIAPAKRGLSCSKTTRQRTSI